MSKEHHISQVEKKVKQPEVGDVWSWNGVKIFITCVLGDKKIGAISFMDNGDRHHCTDSFDSFDRKIRHGVMVYLGKSIVNIDDLFEVVPELTAKDVTKLMDITGCGMLACKHALIKFKGNSELALDYLMGGWND